MELAKVVMAMLKTLIDWQASTFLADTRSAVMMIVMLDSLLTYIITTAGSTRKASKMESLLVVSGSILIAWIAADAYVTGGK